MLTDKDLLLVKIMEECNEVAHRVSKGLRFGMDEVWDKHPDGLSLTNHERIFDEFLDLYAALNLLDPELYFDLDEGFRTTLIEKRERVTKYLAISLKLQTLAPDEALLFNKARQGTL